MVFDKDQLHLAIESALQDSLDTAIQAAIQAHSTATDEENKAENKYDTLGLEASYLAAGQSNRVVQCKDDLSSFKKLSVKSFCSDSEITLGTLVYLENEMQEQKYIFLSPVGGGISLNFEDVNIMLVTPSSPIGRSLLKAYEGDEINVKQKESTSYYELKKVY